MVDVYHFLERAGFQLQSLGYQSALEIAHARLPLFYTVFKNVEGILLEDVTLENSASWTCYFHRCADIVARRVKIDGHANYNNDGFVRTG